MRTLLILPLGVGLIYFVFRPQLLDKRYFPMRVGDKWIYANFVPTTGRPRAADVVFEVTGTKTLDDTECFVVLRTIGEHRVNFYISVRPSGVYLHQVGDDR